MLWAWCQSPILSKASSRPSFWLSGGCEDTTRVRLFECSAEEETDNLRTSVSIVQGVKIKGGGDARYLVTFLLLLVLVLVFVFTFL